LGSQVCFLGQAIMLPARSFCWPQRASSADVSPSRVAPSWAGKCPLPPRGFSARPPAAPLAAAGCAHHSRRPIRPACTLCWMLSCRLALLCAPNALLAWQCGVPAFDRDSSRWHLELMLTRCGALSRWRVTVAPRHALCQGPLWQRLRCALSHVPLRQRCLEHLLTLSRLALWRVMCVCPPAVRPSRSAMLSPCTLSVGAFCGGASPAHLPVVYTVSQRRVWPALGQCPLRRHLEFELVPICSRSLKQQHLKCTLTTCQAPVWRLVVCLTGTTCHGFV
jgi:hypothetical protein